MNAAHQPRGSKNMSKARERRIEIVSGRLLQKSLPRIQVSLLLSLTGLAGFLVSFSLLHLGVPWMWVRYPIAVLIAYGIFLVLLALWLWFQRRSFDIDPPDLDFIPSGPTEHGDGLQFGGGDAGGAGAGGSWGESVHTVLPVSSEGSSAPSIGLDIDLEEGWFIAIAIVALVGGLIASLYIIYIAPALLAEILVDGALVAGLYKRVKHIEQRHWLRGAVRRTLMPGLLVALFFTIAGYALQKAVPEAHTMAEVWNYLRRS